MKRIFLFAILWTLVFIVGGYAAKQTVNLGTGPATGDGDTVRDGFDIANDNFNELYATQKGDLVVGTAANTVVQLTVGTAGEVPVADSGEASGINWGKIAPASMADADHGEITWLSGVATVDASVIDANNMANSDHGDFTWSTGVGTLDNDVVAPAEMDDADHGEITWLSGVATVDASVIDANNMANSDHGDVEWTTGVAQVEAILASDTPTLTTGDNIAIDRVVTSHQSMLKYYSTTGTQEMSVIALPTTNLTADDDYVIKYDAVSDSFEMQPDLTGGTINSFETHDTPGAGDPVADSGSDTLQWLEGTGITIVGTNDPETVTITWDGTELTGDITGTGTTSIATTLAADVVGLANMTHEDHGEITWITGAAEVDASVIDANNMANSDHGDVEWTTGVAQVESIQASATPSLTVADNIAIDTTVTNHQSMLKYYSATGTQEMSVISLPTTNLTADDNYVIKYDAASDSFEMQADLTGGTINSFETHDTPGVGDPIADSGTDTLQWIEGTGITIVGTDDPETVTITNTSPNVVQNLFETIGGDGATSTIAEIAADTLNIVGGVGITTNASDTGVDTVSIAWDGTELTGAVTGSGTTSIATTLAADIVGVANMIHETHGEVTWSSGSAEVSASVIDANNMANSDHGDVEWTTGVAQVESIQASATPSLTVADNIAIDTTVTNHQSMLKYYSATGTQEMSVIALPTTNLTADDNYVIKYDAGTDTFGMEADLTGGTINSFETHDTPGAGDPIADSSTDTLQWLEGTGISIVGTNDPDTITITWDGTELTGAVTGSGTTSISTTLAADIVGLANMAHADHGDVNWSDGSTASVEAILASATPTLTASDNIAIDTTVAGHQSMLKYYSTTGTQEMAVIALPTTNLTADDNYIIKYNAVTDTFGMEADEVGSGAPNQNLFETIAVSPPNGTNPKAGTATDTLTFTGSLGMYILGDLASNTILFAETNTLSLYTGGIIDDQLVVGSAANDSEYKSIASGVLNYDTTTNAFSLAGITDLSDIDDTTGDGTTAVLDANPTIASMVGTGTIDFSAAGSVEIPNGTNPATTTGGHIAVDVDGVSASQGEIEFHDGFATRFVVATTGQPSSGQIPKFNGTTVNWAADDDSEVNNLETVTTDILEDEIAVGDDAVAADRSTYKALPNGIVQYNTTTDVFSAAAIAGLSDVSGVTGSTEVVVLQQTPTLNSPAISDFQYANHDHGDADDGGTLTLITAMSDVVAKTGSSTTIMFNVNPTVASMNGTGVIDFGSSTSVEITNSVNPTTNATGEIALDTLITDHQPLWQYYDGGENMTVIAIDTSELPAQDDEIVKYDAGTNKFVLEADAGGGDPNQDLFLTISGDGATSAIAEEITDTLYILGGTGITTTATDSGPDTLTIAWDGVTLNGDVTGSGTSPITVSVEAVLDSDTPTLTAADNIAIDRVVADHQSMLKYYSTTGSQEMTVIAVPTGKLTADDNYIIKYDAASDEFGMEADEGGGGGAPDQDLWDVVTADGSTSAAADDIHDTIYFEGGLGIATTASDVLGQANIEFDLDFENNRDDNNSIVLGGSVGNKLKWGATSDGPNIGVIRGLYIRGNYTTESDGYIKFETAGSAPIHSPGDDHALLYCIDGELWAKDDAGNPYNLTADGGGGATSPGGSDTQLQYNNGGSAFGGASGTSWNDATNKLTLTATGDSVTPLDIRTFDATPTASVFTARHNDVITFSVGKADGSRDITFFEGSTVGDTDELVITGYPSGGTKESLGISVGSGDKDTISFEYSDSQNAGASYEFDGNILIGGGSTPPSNADYVMQFHDNNGVPTMQATTAGLYSTGGDMYAVDDDGNEYLLTPPWSGSYFTVSTVDPLDVSVVGVSVVFADTTSNDVTIEGFTGGVQGQMVCVVCENGTNDVIIEHAERGTNEDILTSSGRDERLGGRGGWKFIYDGAKWVEIDQGSNLHIVDVSEFFHRHTGSGYGSGNASKNHDAVQDAINFSNAASGNRGAHILITGYLEVDDDIRNEDTSSGSRRIPLIVDGRGSGHVKQVSLVSSDAAFSLIPSTVSSAGIPSDWLNYIGSGTAIVFEIKNLMISADVGRCVIVTGAYRHNYCQMVNCHLQSKAEEALAVSNSWVGFFQRLSFVGCYPYAIYVNASTNLVFEDIKVLGTGLQARGDAVSGATNFVQLASNASEVDNYYTGDTIYIEDAGSSLKQTSTITSYIGSSRRAYVFPFFTTFTPAGTDAYDIYKDTTEPAVYFSASGSKLSGHFETNAGDAIHVASRGNLIEIWSEACNRSANNTYYTTIPHIQNSSYHNEFRLAHWPGANSGTPHLTQANGLSVYCTDAEALGTMKTNWDSTSGLDIEKLAGYEDAASATNNVGNSSNYTRCYWSLAMLEDLSVNVQTRGTSFQNFETPDYSYAVRKGSTIECKIDANGMDDNQYIDVFDAIADPGFNGHDYDANAMVYARVRYSVSPASYFLDRRREDATGSNLPTNNRVLQIAFKDDTTGTILLRDGYAFCDGVHEITAVARITGDGDISENQFYLWVTNGEDNSHDDVYITIHECEFAIGEPNN